jgi:hypothetical protein
MKITRPIIVCFLFFVSACSELTQDKDIEIVKKSPLELSGSNYVIGDLVKEIAGIKGTTQWKSFMPTDYKDNANVICVQVDITRNMDKNNLIKLQFLLNRETGLVKMQYMGVDGVAKSLMEFYFILLGIGIDNMK